MSYSNKEVEQIKWELFDNVFEKILKEYFKYNKEQMQYIHNNFELLNLSETSKNYDVGNEFIFNFCLNFDYDNSDILSNKDTIDIKDILEDFSNQIHLCTALNEEIENQDFNNGDYCHNVLSIFQTNSTINFILVIQK